MPPTPSTMLDLDTPTPQFRLRDLNGTLVTSDEFMGYPLLVAFLAPHCPFVKHVRSAFGAFARECQEKGIAVVGVMSNDLTVSPNDTPAAMKQEAEEAGYSFPYLIDADQSVAKAFKAACTPDFFLFNADHKLVYRGQFDASRPGNNVPLTGSDLRAAADAVLKGGRPNIDQRPSVGCNIKWRPGAEPEYFTVS